MLENANEEKPGGDVHSCSAEAALPTDASRSAIYVAMVTPGVQHMNSMKLVSPSQDILSSEHIPYLPPAYEVHFNTILRLWNLQTPLNASSNELLYYVRHHSK